MLAAAGSHMAQLSFATALIGMQMDTRGKLQTGLFIGLLVSLALYHVSNQFKSQVLQPPGNIYDFVNLIQFAITIAVFFLVVYNRLVARVILRGGYIGGKYEGKSTHYRQDEGGYAIERFTITQNLFDVMIAGKSFRSADESLTSIWTGRLFKVEGNTYYFGADLSVAAGEVGVFKLTFEDDEVHGFYYSGKPETKYAYSLSAKRIKKTPLGILAEALRW